MYRALSDAIDKAQNRQNNPDIRASHHGGAGVCTAGKLIRRIS